MLAILKREVRSSFQTITGWIYIAVMMAAFSLYYFANNLSYGAPEISYSLSGILFITIIPVAVLTMRSLAEEQRSKTDQLILTAPVSVGKVVTAKFFGMAVIHTLTVIYMFIMTLVLNLFGSTPVAENIVAVFGYWLYGLSCIAIGLFISSLTESQVISAVLTFAALFIGYMMSGITSLISSDGNVITSILELYDLQTPAEKFMDGVFPVDGVIYYVILIGLMLFLTSQSIQKRRWSFSSKKLTTGAYSAGVVIIAIVVAVVLNLVTAQLPSSIASIDFTEQKLYTLTDDTNTFLASLEKDVEIYVLASEDSMENTVAMTLEKYEEATDKITVTYVDPAKNPTFYKEYTDSSVSSGSIIVVCGETSRVIDYSDLFETSFDYTTYSSTTTGYDGEGQITSAIEYVVSDDLPVAYVIDGHGETSLTGDFSDALSKANITSTTINLLEYDAIPDDAAVVIINAPTSDFSTDDAAKIIEYINVGGNLLVSTSYEADDDMTNFESILSEYGLTLESGLIAEQNKSNYYQNPFYLLPNTTSSDYCAIDYGSYVFAPYAMAITVPEDSDTVSYTTILETSDSAVLKKNVDTATTYEAEEGDETGTFVLGVAAEKTVDDETTSKVCVVTSQLMFTDEADSMVSGTNVSLFTGMISAMVDTDGIGSIVIPVKEYSSSNLTIAASLLITFGVAFVVALPIILIIIGITIWLRRRRK
ncbi:MAG: Gldg family protein [Lachnospiraceae bacterium]|nr:Gldg family protein [Lachnospiraceae bacterium]